MTQAMVNNYTKDFNEEERKQFISELEQALSSSFEDLPAE